MAAIVRIRMSIHPERPLVPVPSPFVAPVAFAGEPHCSGGVSGRVSQLCADSAEHPGFLEHPGITGRTPERAASPPYRSTRGVIYPFTALRGNRLTG